MIHTSTPALIESATAWARAQGRHAVASAPRPVRNGKPIGASEFGRLIRWGHGASQARELLRDLRGLARARPALWRAYLNNLRRAGVTAEMAARWAAAYRLASAHPQRLGGATAPERARLMLFLVEQLERSNQSRECARLVVNFVLPVLLVSRQRTSSHGRSAQTPCSPSPCER
jgi:hypothetical protein